MVLENDDGVCDWNQQRIEGDFRKSILYDKNGEVIEKLIELQLHL